MSLIGTQRVEVTWVFYLAIKNGLSYDGMLREVDGLRFRLASGERIGHSRVYENIPDPAEGYPGRKLIGELRTEFAGELLDLVREMKGHR
ncbi:hypothetical protein [Kitasatospora sp. NPDC092286]|uniref:hypothetical protein n=1 Tax=Kitasatospora sp. NPDC092286 TaxID=3364087 RepID=UPI0037FA9CCB